MAKRALAESFEEAPTSQPVTEMVTYVPGPEGPVTTTWCGHKFEANVPKEIKGNAGGTEREQVNATLIERARGNLHFRVGDAKKARDPVKDPTTAEEYRIYFVEWLKSPAMSGEDTHADDLIARYARDRQLQAVCGVGTDDYEFIGNLLTPKLHELSKRDEMSGEQLAASWRRFGFNQLPW